MNIVTKLTKSIGSRVVGGLVSLAAGWVLAKTKGAVQIDPQQVVEVVGTMLGSYAVTHRVVSALGLNPGDAASATLAKAEKDALDQGTAVVPTPPIH